jgi:catechol 2,3-dioxygenase-like lactoylglutathione lyase family enzyme
MSARLRLVPALLVVVLGVALTLHMAPSRAGSTVDPAAARGVGGVAITVEDADRSVAFYSSVLFFEKVSDVRVSGPEVEQLFGVAGARVRVVTMRLGAERIELLEFVAPKGRPIPADARSNDRWFQHIAIIVNDMDQADLWLRRHHVARISPEPQRLPDWNPNAGGIRALYFKDPDGHALEILQFPPGKGDARWQRPSDSVFLGIDHTAIVVGNTDRSLAFYRDTLGLRIVGGSGARILRTRGATISFAGTPCSSRPTPGPRRPSSPRPRRPRLARPSSRPPTRRSAFAAGSRPRTRTATGCSSARVDPRATTHRAVARSGRLP